jgi:hypothetical protein
MSDASNIAKSLRDRLSENTEERLGKALSDLLENPLITGAIGRAFDARERASQAQEVAMGALNIPSAADIERLTRRLRAVSHRLEGIEEGVHRLDRAFSPTSVDARLSAIEEQIGKLANRLGTSVRSPVAAAARRATSSKARPSKAKAAGKAKATKAKAKPKATKAKAVAKAKAAKAKAKPKAKAAKAKATKTKAASKAKATRTKATAAKAKARKS